MSRNLPRRAFVSIFALVLAACGGGRDAPAPLDPATRAAMVAALPKHSFPVPLDVSDGYTFGGLQRSLRSGAITSSVEQTFGPFLVDMHSPQHMLSWNRGVVDDVLDCEPGQNVHNTDDTVTNQVVIHYTTDVSGMPGDLTAVNVVIPSYQESPPGTTGPFPIDQVEVSVVINSGGRPVSGTLAPAPPPPGAQVNFLGSFVVPLPVVGAVEVDIALTGEVQPPLRPPSTFLLGCPPPNDGLAGLQTFGLTQFIAENTFAVLYIEPSDLGPLVVHPDAVDLAPGETAQLTAWSCPPAGDVGPDGEPGTGDDDCMQVAADWSTTSGLGDVSPSSGSTTTFTAGDAAPGQALSGAIVARVGGDSAFADAVVTGRDGDETHGVRLEVERMFRQGLPLADDVSAGDLQVVVRPTTAHELNESLGTMVVGGVVIPFDARASLLGELAGAQRTIAATDPPDLALMRQGILDDIDASGRDSTDPRHVARFLRRDPRRGRVTLTLDTGVASDLSTDAAGYVGSADAGFIGFRADLVLREAQRETLVTRRGEERRVAVGVEFVENDAVTNLLPYDDSLSAREANRLRRSPARGGIFQGADLPGIAQLIAVADGRGRESRTRGREIATLYTARVGEDTDASAHALAHLLGHLLYGGRHDRRDPLSIMQAPPGQSGAGDDFYTENFDDFRYSDRTVRRGIGHLDRYWRK